MNPQNEAVSLLLRLPATTLADLGHALSEGALCHGFSSQSLIPLVGNQARAIDQALRTLNSDGSNQIAAGLLCQSLGRALAERDAVEGSVQLVISGPEVAGTPVIDTQTTIMSLFEEANEEVLISSYVFHDARKFFQRLAEKYDANPAFRITFFVDLSHRRD